MRPDGALRRVFPFLTAAGCGLLLVAIAAPAQVRVSRNEATALSKPSEERKLSFSGGGVVREMKVKEGDTVKAGQVLITQEDVIDTKELERLKLEAESMARVEAADADLKVKQAKLKRMELGGPGAFNDAEMDEAQNDVLLREKQLQVAKEEQQQAKIKVEQQSRKLELLRLTSPIDGVVVDIVTKPGEWADPQSREGAALVVKNDPLYIEVRELTTRQVAMLKVGQKLKVRYANDAQSAWQDAEIFYFSPVADAASDTQLVKLRLPNPDGRASGLGLVVQLPENVASAGNPLADVAGK